MTEATKIARRRMELGMKQPEVASKAGIPLSTYQKLDNGSNDFNKANVITAIKIAKALETTVEKLMEES